MRARNVYHPYIMMKNEILGIMAPWLIDTGANVSVMSNYGRNQGNDIILNEFSIGNGIYKNVIFLLQDLRVFSGINDQKQGGTIGTDLLCTKVLFINFEKAKIGFFKKSYRPPLGLIRLPLIEYSNSPDPEGLPNIPTLVVDIDGYEVKMQIDTGKSNDGVLQSISVNQQLLDIIGKNHTLEKTHSETVNVSNGSFFNVSHFKATPTPILKIGDFEIPIQDLELQPSLSLPFSRNEPIGIMGMPLLSLFEYIIIDPFRKECFISNNVTFGRANYVNKCMEIVVSEKMSETV